MRPQPLGALLAYIAETTRWCVSVKASGRLKLPNLASTARSKQCKETPVQVDPLRLLASLIRGLTLGIGPSAVQVSMGQIILSEAHRRDCRSPRADDRTRIISSVRFVAKLNVNKLQTLSPPLADGSAG